MKPQPFDSGWALLFGVLGAPLLSAINMALLDRLLVHPTSRYSAPSNDLIFFVLILTTPLGFITMRMLDIWNGGQHGRARALGIGSGIFAVLFWAWFWSSPPWSSYQRAHLAGAFAIPFLWSMSLPLCALFARAPKV